MVESLAKSSTSNRPDATLTYRHPAGSPSDPKDLGGGASLPAQILPARVARPQDDVLLKAKLSSFVQMCLWSDV
jgi:hypothetical protein